jgi:hypothetical protein
MPMCETDGFVLPLAGEWIATTCRHMLWGPLHTETTAATGMSGSPILATDGSAIGVISTGDIQVNLAARLPGWFLARLGVFAGMARR